ncbi:MAG: helix-turn-helix domain-containing protein [Pirellulaceae bacterium]
MIRQSIDSAENDGRDLTISEVAAVLCVNRSTVSAYIRSGALPAWIVNPAAKRLSYRIRPEALDELRKRQAVVSPQKVERTRRVETKKKWY